MVTRLGATTNGSHGSRESERYRKPQVMLQRKKCTRRTLTQCPAKGQPSLWRRESAHGMWNLERTPEPGTVAAFSAEHPRRLTGRLKSTEPGCHWGRLAKPAKRRPRGISLAHRPGWGLPLHTRNLNGVGTRRASALGWAPFLQALRNRSVCEPRQPAC